MFVIQDWEREKHMEDVYLIEKQIEMEMKYWNSLKRKPAKIRIKNEEKVKLKPRAFRRARKKGMEFRYGFPANMY